MTLLHKEIDLEPGRPPMQPPNEPNVVGKGSAVVRLTNDTDQENAFSIRVECSDPYWKEEWVTMSTLLPKGVSPTDRLQRDVPGTGNHSLRATFVPAGKSRDVVLSFSAEQTSEARCGVYRFKVIVEQAIKAAGSSLRIFREEGDLIVRPFYKWTVEVSPELQAVGLVRRSREYNFVIQNHGNDWLYCEVIVPKAKDWTCGTTVSRIAVPPPEPGAESTRHIPFTARTRLKTKLGVATPQQLNLSLKRIDAPSVPPLAPQAAIAPIGAGLGAAVLSAPTAELGPLEPPTLEYRPIPNSLTGFGKFIVTNFKGLIFGFIGVYIAFGMMTILFAQTWRSVKEVHLNSLPEAGKDVGVSGTYIEGTVMIVFNDANGQEVERQRVSHLKPDTFKIGTFDGTVHFDNAIPNGKYHVVFERDEFPFNIWPPPMKHLWDSPPVPFSVGGDAPANSDHTVYVDPGSTSFHIRYTDSGQKFGESPGKVILEGGTPSVSKWTSDEIDCSGLDTTTHKPGSTYKLEVDLADGTPLPMKLVVNPLPPPPPPTTTGATSTVGESTAGNGGLPGATGSDTGGGTSTGNSSAAGNSSSGSGGTGGQTSAASSAVKDALSKNDFQGAAASAGADPNLKAVIQNLQSISQIATTFGASPTDDQLAQAQGNFGLAWQSASGDLKNYVKQQAIAFFQNYNSTEYAEEWKNRN